LFHQASYSRPPLVEQYIGVFWHNALLRGLRDMPVVKVTPSCGLKMKSSKCFLLSGSYFWCWKRYLRFVTFVVRFCFPCKFSILKEATFDSSLTSLWVCFDCIDNRLRQIAIFVFVKVGKGRGFVVMLKDFDITKLFCIVCSLII